MSPARTTKGTRRYRYYVSRIDDPDAGHRPWRLPAREIEQLVAERLALIGSGTALTDRLGQLSGETAELLRQRSPELSTRIATPDMLIQLNVAVQVHDDRITLTLDPQALLGLVVGEDAARLDLAVATPDAIELTIPVQLKRRGQELRLVLPAGDATAPTRVDAKLVELLVKAHHARDALTGSEPVGGDKAHLTRLARLSYLAPDIVSAIVDGRQPADLCARHLLRTASLPICWQAQRELLGFA
jgi:site-specific DNA recombinase